MLREQRRLAIQLRKEGKSYSEIKKLIKASKSSLSLWLRDYPLTSFQLRNLDQKKKIQIENFKLTMKRKREERLKNVYEKMRSTLLPLSEKEMLIAGLFLYLGEGAKQKPGHIFVSNTDPNIVKFVLNWYTRILRITKDKVKVNLQLYKDMDIEKEVEFWSSLLDIPRSNFWKPYIKKSETQDIDHSGFKHGTCGIYFGSVTIHEEIMMGTKCILDHTNNGRVA